MYSYIIIMKYCKRYYITDNWKLAIFFHYLSDDIERGGCCSHSSSNKRTVMFRLWAKVFKDNRMLKDMVICNDNQEMNRTKKIFEALDEICHTYDLSKPIWLDSTIADFKRHDKARFTQDNFMEPIEFDYLEIHVIEED